MLHAFTNTHIYIHTSPRTWILNIKSARICHECFCTIFDRLFRSTLTHHKLCLIIIVIQCCWLTVFVLLPTFEGWVGGWWVDARWLNAGANQAQVVDVRPIPPTYSSATRIQRTIPKPQTHCMQPAHSEKSKLSYFHWDSGEQVTCVCVRTSI